MDAASFARSTYRIIENKANSNSLIQGVTGIFGFPYTLIADGAVIFTHYGVMWNEIRALKGYAPVSKEAIEPIVRGISDEILYDLIGDKLLGNIPIIGIYFNAICAKTMTWRLGTLFAMLALKGEETHAENAAEMARRIRIAFPQSDAMRFKQPPYGAYEALLQAFASA